MSSLPYYICYNCDVGLFVSPTSPIAESFCCPGCSLPYLGPHTPPSPTPEVHANINPTYPMVVDNEDAASLYTDSENDYDPMLGEDAAEDEDVAMLLSDSESEFDPMHEENVTLSSTEDEDDSTDSEDESSDDEEAAPVYNNQEDDMDIDAASLLTSLPGVKQFPNMMNSKESTCSICMEEFGTKIVVELPCKHSFDNKCIVEWIKRTDTCPLCRLKLPFDEHKLVLARRNDI